MRKSFIFLLLPFLLILNSLNATAENPFMSGQGSSPYGDILNKIKRKPVKEDKSTEPYNNKPSKPLSITPRTTNSPLQMQMQKQGVDVKSGPDDPGIDIDKLVKRFLACGDNNECWGRVNLRALKEYSKKCITNSTCLALVSIDVNIANAVARTKYDAKKEGIKQTNNRIKPLKIAGAMPERTYTILAQWKKKLEAFIPVDIRKQVDKYAEKYPVKGDASPFPVMFVLRGSEGIQNLVPRVSRRDWAYALLGGIFSQIGVSSKEKARFLDLALWCFIRAAESRKDEAEHLSNIGFIFNLMRRYKEARDILMKARTLNPHHPDIRGNLSFSLRRLGQDREADRELEAAAQLEIAAMRTGIEKTVKGKKYKGALPAPYDNGLLYFRFSREHFLSTTRLMEEYRKASEVPLETAQVYVKRYPDTPFAIYKKRRKANERSWDACTKNIPPVPPVCSNSLVLPESPNCVSPAVARLKELENKRAECKCGLAFAERDLKDYKVYVNDQINLFKSFDKEWTIKLEMIARDWKNRIDMLNAIYSEAERYHQKAPLRAPWPDLSWQLLEEHYRNIYEFQTTKMDEFTEGLNERAAKVMSAEQGCQQRARALTEYRKEFVKEELAKGIRCAPVIGNTTTISIPLLVKMDVFIATGGSDMMAVKIKGRLPIVSGEYWSAWKPGSESRGGKVSVGLGPVSGEVWGDTGGDWGAGGSINLIAAINPLGRLSGIGKSLGGTGGEAAGKATGRVLGKFIKTEFKVGWKVEKGKGISKTSNVKLQSTIGYKHKTGVYQPGWIRLHSRARKKDKWPRSLFNKPLPSLPKMCP